MRIENDLLFLALTLATWVVGGAVGTLLVMWMWTSTC